MRKTGISTNICKHQTEWAKCRSKCRGLYKYRERVISLGIKEGFPEEVALELAWRTWEILVSVEGG